MSATSLPKKPLLYYLVKRCLLTLTFAPLLFLCVERLCHRATDGFSIARMSHPLPTDAEFTPPHLDQEKKQQLLSIFSQPFYYLSCGGQSYVFISEDHNYVIKFLKFHHRRIPGWIEHLPLPSKLDVYRQDKMQKKELRLKKTFRSYVIAYDLFKEETRTIYHHLQTTCDLQQSVVFFDRLGYRYELSLDDYAFLVQKRGVSTAKMLKELMQQGDTLLAQAKLEELLRFAIKRFQKGLFDRDFKFNSNLGFIDGTAAQIDLGSLSLDPKQSMPEVYKPAIYEAAGRFRTWLQIEHPTLVEGFDQTLQRLLADK